MDDMRVSLRQDSPLNLLWWKVARRARSAELDGVVGGIVLVGFACQAEIRELQSRKVTELCSISFPEENIGRLDVPVDLGVVSMEVLYPTRRTVLYSPMNANWEPLDPCRLAP